MIIWQRITASQARQHPLYGVKGWAIVGLIVLVLKIPAQTLRSGSLTLLELRLHGDFNQPIFFIITGLALMVWLVYIIYLLCTKDGRFQGVFLGFLVCDVLLNFIHAFVAYDGLQESIYFTQSVRNDFLAQTAFAVVSYLLVNIGFYVYVDRSKRIRVTFKYEVRRDDPFAIQLRSPTSRSSQSYEPPSTGPDPVPPIKVPSPAIKNLKELSDDELYALAWNEVEDGNQDEGLWARLFVENDGDENRTKVSYLKHRVKELQIQRKKEIEEEENRPHEIEKERQRREQEEAERRKALGKKKKKEEEQLLIRLKDSSPLIQWKKEDYIDNYLKLKHAVQENNTDWVLRLIRSGANPTGILGESDTKVKKTLQFNLDLKHIITVASRLWKSGKLTEDGLAH